MRMGFIDNIRNLFRRSTTAEGNAANTASADIPRTGGVFEYPTGTALNVSTVYRCVNMLADSVANLPVQYKRMKGDIFTEDKSSRLHYLLNVQPCGYMSAVDFWQLVVQYMLLRGNAYIVPVYDPFTMDIDRLCLVNPACVSHDTINDTYTVCDVKQGLRVCSGFLPLSESSGSAGPPEPCRGEPRHEPSRGRCRGWRPGCTSWPS